MPKDFDPTRYASFSVKEVVEEPVAREVIHDYVEKSRLSRRLGFWSECSSSFYLLLAITNKLLNYTLVMSYPLFKAVYKEIAKIEKKHTFLAEAIRSNIKTHVATFYATRERMSKKLKKQ